jgi:hypothetical protein
MELCITANSLCRNRHFLISRHLPRRFYAAYNISIRIIRVVTTAESILEALSLLLTLSIPNFYIFVLTKQDFYSFGIPWRDI